MFKSILHLFLALMFFLSPRPLYAQGEFENKINVEYLVQADGKTRVTYSIALTNLLTNIYATAYSISLTGINPENIRVYQGDDELQFDLQRNGEESSIKILFEDAIVGKGKTRFFFIAFDDQTVAQKTGEVWEISIPRLLNSDEFNDYSVFLKVDKALGELAYISPEPTEIIQADQKTFRFDKNTISSSGVVAAFGQFQVFSYNLTYHLENPLPKSAVTEIAIPPDTAYQKVIYESIKPEPHEVTVDQDGNWILKYKLKGRERVDVVASGNVQIFTSPRYDETLTPSQIEMYLASDQNWQTGSKIVQESAKGLKTPRDVYNYTVSTLSYNYQRVSPNVDRFGAERALLNPREAICMEFTDVFVALARANGIPAREINGYAYTENKKLQPLSLVADVLHSWPEYWDEEQKNWIPVDPTWGDTTGGMDFFSKLDLRHFAFVIHGQSSIKPYPPGSYKLGPSPQKDIYVSFGRLVSIPKATPRIEVKINRKFPFFKEEVLTSVRNEGQISIRNESVSVFYDGRLVHNENIDVLPPYASRIIVSEIPFSPLGIGTPNRISVTYSAKTIETPTNKLSIIIISLLFTFVLIFLIVFYGFLKVRKSSLLHLKKTSRILK